MSGVWSLGLPSKYTLPKHQNQMDAEAVGFSDLTPERKAADPSSWSNLKEQKRCIGERDRALLWAYRGVNLWSSNPQLSGNLEQGTLKTSVGMVKTLEHSGDSEEEVGKEEVSGYSLKSEREWGISVFFSFLFKFYPFLMTVSWLHSLLPTRKVIGPLN